MGEEGVLSKAMESRAQRAADDQNLVETTEVQGSTVKRLEANKVLNCSESPLSLMERMAVHQVGSQW